MNLESKNTIGTNSSDVLMQLVKEMKVPLASLMEANKRLTNVGTSMEKNDTNEVIFTSSQEIASLIEEVVKLANNNKPVEKLPIIYEIYHGNERVKSMCKQEINPNKISKQDTSWLIEMESEVYKNIKHKDLNLYDLSYKMAVSERQLHRKIKSLLHLTPNKYIRILRLHKAKQFIDDYMYDTISQISYAVGYYDTHYFSKLFCQQYGAFPKELLRERKL
ncbi:HTH-type transcriptional activator RhaS [Kordia sp. SMS9]|uniref:helix-turn-helix domain-containing protein n=1 Tax=Kordia sp. SMS9 TaxID=2282170 RepID=UPI000E0D2BF7|nr:helix-turn-helix domain-containing protein [Kordia sp. SMS9]AXG69023.1 HTH-type transcriptional activator RhaS [Kordia sp. SMS9]